MGKMDDVFNFLGAVKKAVDQTAQQGAGAPPGATDAQKLYGFLKKVGENLSNQGVKLPQTGSAPQNTPTRPSSRSRVNKTPFPKVKKDFNPGENAFSIQYKNYAGELKTFTGDKRTVCETKTHFSVRVGPTGKRIYLVKKSVKNAAELQAVAGPTPHGRDKQVLCYHLRHSSTSPKFEEAKKKFATWL